MNVQVSSKWIEFSKEKPTYFRKKIIYDSLKKSLNFQDWSQYSICPFSGPIAFCKFNEITIITNLGKEIEKFTLFNEEILTFSWNLQEELIILTKKNIYKLDILGHLIEKFSLLDSIIQEEVFLYQIYENSVCILTNHLKLYIFNKKEWNRVEILLKEPEYIHLLDSETILVSYTGSFTVIGPKINKSHPFLHGPIRKVIGSPFIAVTENNEIFIFNSNGNSSQILMNDEPVEIAFIDGYIVLLFESDESTILMLLNSDGVYKRFIYSYPIKIKQEIDGIRIISETSMEFLEKVSDSTYKIFKIGSKEPGSLLFDIYSNIEESNNRIFQLNEFINLNEAVNDCLEASKYEYDQTIQNNLLKAAFHGNLTLKNNDFLDLFKKLGALNALKRIGYPLTYLQLETISLNQMFENMIKRRKFKLCLSIADFLQVPKYSIWLEYCYELVMSHLEDDDIYNHIISMLPVDFQFHLVASKAYFIGKRKLAIQILNHELEELSQIKLLVHMDEIQKAIDKAIAWNQTDYLYYILFNTKKSRNFPILEEMNKKKDSLSWSMENLPILMETFKNQSKYFEVKMIQERLTLIDELKDKKFSDLPLQDVFYLLILQGDVEKVEKLAQKFQVSKKKLVWIKANVFLFLGKIKDIDYVFLGYENFIELLIQYKRFEEAKKYILEFPIENKLEYFLKLGFIQDAIKYCFEMKDLESLKFIQSRGLKEIEKKLVQEYLFKLNNDK